MQLHPAQRALHEQLLRSVVDTTSGSHDIPIGSRIDDDGDVTYIVAGPLSFSFKEDEGAQWYKESAYTPDLLTKYIAELRAIENIDQDALTKFERTLQTFAQVFDPIAATAETTVLICRAVTHRLPLAATYEIGLRPADHQSPWKASLCVVLPESLSRSLV